MSNLLAMPRYLDNKEIDPVYKEVWQKTLKELPFSQRQHEIQEKTFEINLQSLQDDVQLGDLLKIKVHVSWWDSCKNGHNTFRIEVKEDCVRFHPSFYGNKPYFVTVHSENPVEAIKTYFPQLANLADFYRTLFSPYGPLYFFENTDYFARQKEKDNAARSCLLTKINLTAEIFDMDQKQRLQLLSEKLPGLVFEFKKEIESLGFTY